MKNTTKERRRENNRKIELTKSRRQLAVKVVFSVIYALFALLGEPDHWRELLESPMWLLLLCGIGTVLFSFVLLSVLFWLMDLAAERGRRAQRKKYPLSDKRFYAAAVCLCLLCWLPWFLIEYPGWVSNDSVWQLEQICGQKAWSNHHPFLHTMLIQLFFEIGRGLTGSFAAGVGLYIFVQMVFLSCVYARILLDLYKKEIHPVWIAAAFLFYAVLPVNGIYAIGMGKDTLFAAVLLLFARDVYRLGRGETAGKSLAVTGLLVCMLRSNGILIFCGTAAGLILCGIRRKQWMRITVCCAFVLISYLVYQGPVLDALKVERPDVIEGMTMPMQHMLSAYCNGGTLTQEQTEYLASIVPLEQLEDYYNASFFDLVKNHIREAGNQQIIAQDKGKFIWMWLTIGLKNPLQYLEAEVRQTYGYWGFHVETPLYEQYRMAENPFGLTVERKLFSYDSGLKEAELLMRFQEDFHRIWSLGLTTWLLLACTAYALYRSRSVLPYLPYLFLFVSLLLATPVYAEFRYTYGIFVAIPFLLAVTLAGEDKGCALRGRGKKE